MKYEIHEGKVVVCEVEDRDCWNLDYTLAPLILASLKHYEASNDISFFMVDSCDVPDTLATFGDNWDAMCEKKTQDKAEKEFRDRYEWVMAQMIWAFDRLATDDADPLPNTTAEFRINRGITLFGKYFRALWT